MSTLRIKHSGDWFYSSRKISIYLNGKKVGTVSNNEIKEFDIQPGHHKVKAKIDWCGSKNYDLEIKNNTTKSLAISGIKNTKYVIGSLLIMLSFPTLVNIFFNAESQILSNICLGLSLVIISIIVYYMIFKRKTYLTISELNKTRKI